jgi:GTP-binding protein EngB required for normal cell division
LLAAAKRTTLELPAVLLNLRADQVASCAATVEAALQAGATGVVLSASGEQGSGQFFDVACSLRALLRGRALLLLAERPDVAAAADADGVLLSPGSLPTLLARKALPDSRLVLRLLASAEEAAAAARDGADGLVLYASPEALGRAVLAAGSVPVLASFASGSPKPAELAQLSAVGARGALLDRLRLSDAALASLAASTRSALLAGAPSAAPDSAAPPADAPLLSDAAAALLDSERFALSALLEWLAAACPELPEAALLEEALIALGGPFLLVVAGEFNSGKSSVLNALLGERVLKEGVLPTTNEITVIRAAPEQPRGGAPPQQLRAGADGRFELLLCSPLLRQLSLVDTPGTNVILERQQRLTEEYVPKADLVLFVLSADRPLTESEVRFLTYIRQWQKRVVFALNKVDALPGPAEVQAVRGFVATNAQRLLGTSLAEVFPVSARAALAAKQAAAVRGAPPPPWGAPPRRLTQQRGWEESGFAQLEAWIATFLAGDAAAGERAGEALRLKLLTPLQLASALLDAAQRGLQARCDASQAEAQAVQAVRRQLAAFEQDMRRDAEVQRGRVRETLRAQQKRAQRFVDDTLRLQSAELLAALQEARPEARLKAERTLAGARDEEGTEAALEGDSLARAYLRGVAAGSREELLAAAAEHSAWLKRNSERQQTHYAAAVAQRGRGGSSPPSPLPSAGAATEPCSSEAWRIASSADARQEALETSQSLRGAALGSAGGAAGSLAFGAALAGVLPGGGEEALALALAASGAYVGLLSLPLRRSELKARLDGRAEALAGQLEGALCEELDAELQAATGAVEQLVGPWDAEQQAEASRLQALVRGGEAHAAALRELQVRVMAL